MSHIGRGIYSVKMSIMYGGDAAFGKNAVSIYIRTIKNPGASNELAPSPPKEGLVFILFFWFL